MNFTRVVISLTLVLILFHEVAAFVDPVSFGVIVIGVGLAIGLIKRNAKELCTPTELCIPNLIKPDLVGLEEELSTKVYGQHLVKDVVVKSISTHLRQTNPKKPLVLSFHGWTGGGKTYVSEIIAKHLYPTGSKSQFFHFYSATRHFPHPENVKTYQDNLRNWILNNVSQCADSMFVFDEADKFPKGLFGGIISFLDFHERVKGVVYKRAIFIFLSNAGGDVISKIAWDFWKNGKEREDITLYDIDHELSLDHVNENRGFTGSDLIASSLVGHFVAFLPLTRSHVISCIKDEFLRRRHAVDDHQVEKVASKLKYFPAGTNLFSTSGCKRIEKLVDLVLED